MKGVCFKASSGYLSNGGACHFKPSSAYRIAGRLRTLGILITHDMRKLIFPLLLGAAMNSFSSERITFQSATNRTPLLELYTSEGCSSCPPAEEWLSRLKSSARLWQDFVPVAFHVDYWDYLGWRDPFGAPGYSERQRDYAAEWKSRSVYTPGFVLDGQEWRGWYGQDELSRVFAPPTGILTAGSDDGKRWFLRFQPVAENSSTVTFHVALLGFDLDSDVKAGENRGRRLRHDFVVLALATATSTTTGASLQAEMPFMFPSRPLPKRLAVAIWVSRRGDLPSLQAVGGWLPASNH